MDKKPPQKPPRFPFDKANPNNPGRKVTSTTPRVKTQDRKPPTGTRPGGARLSNRQAPVGAKKDVPGTSGGAAGAKKDLPGTSGGAAGAKKDLPGTSGCAGGAKKDLPGASSGAGGAKRSLMQEAKLSLTRKGVIKSFKGTERFGGRGAAKPAAAASARIPSGRGPVKGVKSPVEKESFCTCTESGGGTAANAKDVICLGDSDNSDMPPAVQARDESCSLQDSILDIPTPSEVRFTGFICDCAGPSNASDDQKSETVRFGGVDIECTADDNKKTKSDLSSKCETEENKCEDQLDNKTNKKNLTIPLLKEDSLQFSEEEPVQNKQLDSSFPKEYMGNCYHKKMSIHSLSELNLFNHEICDDSEKGLNDLYHCSCISLKASKSYTDNRHLTKNKIVGEEDNKALGSKTSDNQCNSSLLTLGDNYKEEKSSTCLLNQKKVRQGVLNNEINFTEEIKCPEKSSATCLGDINNRTIGLQSIKKCYVETIEKTSITSNNLQTEGNTSSHPNYSKKICKLSEEIGSRKDCNYNAYCNKYSSNTQNIKLETMKFPTSQTENCLNNVITGNESCTNRNGILEESVNSICNIKTPIEGTNNKNVETTKFDELCLTEENGLVYINNNYNPNQGDVKHIYSCLKNVLTQDCSETKRNFNLNEKEQDNYESICEKWNENSCHSSNSVFFTECSKLIEMKDNSQPCNCSNLQNILEAKSYPTNTTRESLCDSNSWLATSSDDFCDSGSRYTCHESVNNMDRKGDKIILLTEENEVIQCQETNIQPKKMELQKICSKSRGSLISGEGDFEKYGNINNSDQSCCMSLRSDEKNQKICARDKSKTKMVEFNERIIICPNVDDDYKMIESDYLNLDKMDEELCEHSGDVITVLSEEKCMNDIEDKARHLFTPFNKQKIKVCPIITKNSIDCYDEIKYDQTCVSEKYDGHSLSCNSKEKSCLKRNIDESDSPSRCTNKRIKFVLDGDLNNRIRVSRIECEAQPVQDHSGNFVNFSDTGQNDCTMNYESLDLTECSRDFEEVYQDSECRNVKSANEPIPRFSEISMECDLNANSNWHCGNINEGAKKTAESDSFKRKTGECVNNVLSKNDKCIPENHKNLYDVKTNRSRSSARYDGVTKYYSDSGNMVSATHIGKRKKYPSHINTRSSSKPCDSLKGCNSKKLFSKSCSDIANDLKNGEHHLTIKEDCLFSSEMKQSVTLLSEESTELTCNEKSKELAELKKKGLEKLIKRDNCVSEEYFDCNDEICCLHTTGDSNNSELIFRKLDNEKRSFKNNPLNNPKNNFCCDKCENYDEIENRCIADSSNNMFSEVNCDNSPNSCESGTKKNKVTLNKKQALGVDLCSITASSIIDKDYTKNADHNFEMNSTGTNEMCTLGSNVFDGDIYSEESECTYNSGTHLKYLESINHSAECDIKSNENNNSLNNFYQKSDDCGTKNIHSAKTNLCNRSENISEKCSVVNKGCKFTESDCSYDNRKEDNCLNPASNTLDDSSSQSNDIFSEAMDMVCEDGQTFSERGGNSTKNKRETIPSEENYPYGVNKKKYIVQTVDDTLCDKDPYFCGAGEESCILHNNECRNEGNNSYQYNGRFYSNTEKLDSQLKSQQVGQFKSQQVGQFNSASVHSNCNKQLFGELPTTGNPLDSSKRFPEDLCKLEKKICQKRPIPTFSEEGEDCENSSCQIEPKDLRVNYKEIDFFKKQAVLKTTKQCTSSNEVIGVDCNVSNEVCSCEDEGSLNKCISKKTEDSCEWRVKCPVYGSGNNVSRTSSFGNCNRQSRMCHSENFENADRHSGILKSESCYAGQSYDNNFFSEENNCFENNIGDTSGVSYINRNKKTSSYTCGNTACQVSRNINSKNSFDPLELTEPMNYYKNDCCLASTAEVYHFSHSSKFQNNNLDEMASNESTILSFTEENESTSKLNGVGNKVTKKKDMPRKKPLQEIITDKRKSLADGIRYCKPKQPVQNKIKDSLEILADTQSLCANDSCGESLFTEENQPCNSKSEKQNSLRCRNTNENIISHTESKINQKRKTSAKYNMHSKRTPKVETFEKNINPVSKMEKENLENTKCKSYHKTDLCPNKDDLFSEEGEHVTQSCKHFTNNNCKNTVKCTTGEKKNLSMYQNSIKNKFCLKSEEGRLVDKEAKRISQRAPASMDLSTDKCTSTSAETEIVLNKIYRSSFETGNTEDRSCETRDSSGQNTTSSSDKTCTKGEDTFYSTPENINTCGENVEDKNLTGVKENGVVCLPQEESRSKTSIKPQVADGATAPCIDSTQNLQEKKKLAVDKILEGVDSSSKCLEKRDLQMTRDCSNSSAIDRLTKLIDVNPENEAKTQEGECKERFFSEVTDESALHSHVVSTIGLTLPVCGKESEENKKMYSESETSVRTVGSDGMWMQKAKGLMEMLDAETQSVETLCEEQGRLFTFYSDQSLTDAEILLPGETEFRKLNTETHRLSNEEAIDFDEMMTRKRRSRGVRRSNWDDSTDEASSNTDVCNDDEWTLLVLKDGRKEKRRGDWASAQKWLKEVSQELDDCDHWAQEASKGLKEAKRVSSVPGSSTSSARNRHRSTNKSWTADGSSCSVDEQQQHRECCDSSGANAAIVCTQDSFLTSVQTCKHRRKNKSMFVTSRASLYRRRRQDNVVSELE